MSMSQLFLISPRISVTIKARIADVKKQRETQFNFIILILTFPDCRGIFSRISSVCVKVQWEEGRKGGRISYQNRKWSSKMKSI